MNTLRHHLAASREAYRDARSTVDLGALAVARGGGGAATMSATRRAPSRWTAPWALGVAAAVVVCVLVGVSVVGVSVARSKVALQNLTPRMPDLALPKPGPNYEKVPVLALPNMDWSEWR